MLGQVALQYPVSQRLTAPMVTLLSTLEESTNREVVRPIILW